MKYSVKNTSAKNVIIFLYTILFLIVAFAGSGQKGLFIFNYTAECAGLMGGLLLLGNLMKQKDFRIVSDKKILALFLLQAGYVVWGFFTYTYDKSATQAHVLRYACFLLTMTFAIAPETISAIMKYSQKYVVFIAICYLCLYPINELNGAFLGSYQNVAGALSIGMLLYLTEFFSIKKIERRTIIEFMIVIIALIMTGKRTFTIVPLVLFAVFYIFLKEKKVRIKIFKILIPVLVMGVLLFILNPDLFETFNRIAELSTDESYNGRDVFWELALHLWERNKNFGIGFGTFASYIENNMRSVYADFDVTLAYDAHNIYYQLLAEAGTVGFVIFLVFFIYSLISTFKLFRNKDIMKIDLYRNLIYKSLFIQIWFLLYGFTGNPLYMINQFFVYLFGIMIGQSIKTDLKVK